MREERYIPAMDLGSLGLVALRKRPIHPGQKFDRLFPKPVRKDHLLTKDGSVNETVALCEKIVKSTLADTKQISKKLLRATRLETCKAIFDFFYKHYQYKQDKPGVEQLRSPARAWHDRGNSLGGGIDCDCFSISVSSVLTNLNIPHYFRIVKMYGRNYYQHIYVVVPKCSTSDMNIRSNYIAIDPVLDQFDYEAPEITYKIDKKMGMPIQYLNGVNALPALGREFDGLGQGLGCAQGEGLYNDYLKRQKLNLINTRNAIERNPRKVESCYQPKKLLGMYDELIGAWDDEVQREFTLEKLSGIEEEALLPQLQGLGSVIHGDFNDKEADEILDALEGLGLFKKAKNKEAKPETNTKKTGVFTKIKNATKKVKEAVQKTGPGALNVAKKVGQAVVKYNPVSTAARLGYLAAMKTNFSKLASRAYWGYFTEAQAKAKGVSSSYWKDAKTLKDQLEKTFVNTLKGKQENLKDAIISGRGAEKAGELAAKGSLKGLGLVEVGASIAAAIAFLTPIIISAKGIFSKHKGDPEETENAVNTENDPIVTENSEINEESEGINPDGTPKKKNFLSNLSTPAKIGLGIGALAFVGGVAYVISRPKKRTAGQTAINGIKKPIVKHKKTTANYKTAPKKRSIATVKLS